MARLIIYDETNGENTIYETFELSASRILIGSDPDNQLVIDSPDVDFSHASIELRNDTWVLQDLGGPGGTGVNGKSIDGPYHLTHEDLIELGPIKMAFQERYTDPLPPSLEIGHSNGSGSNSATSSPVSNSGTAIKGRVWFAFIAGGTLGIIFIIMLLMIVADYLNLIEISDLIPLSLVVGQLML